MKKKSIAKIIGMTLGIFLVLASLLFVYEIHSLKQICFFDYDLTSRDAAFRDFEKLGFKYDEDIDVFQKKLLLGDIDVYLFDSDSSHSDKDYIRFSFNHRYFLKMCFKIILFWFHEYNIAETDLIGMAYPVYNTSFYNCQDRCIYLTSTPECGLLFLEFDHIDSQ